MQTTPSQPDIWVVITALATVAAVLISIYSIIKSNNVSAKQDELSEKFRQQDLSFSQGKNLISLYDQFQGMPSINPDEPNWKDVARAANFLDMLGVAWKTKIVEEKYLSVAFDLYVIETFEAIVKCKDPPAMVPKDGKAMLDQCEAATDLYKHFISKRNRGRL